MRNTLIILTAFILSGCQESDAYDPFDGQIWTIDVEYVRQGCNDGRDCIPSLQKPNRSDADGNNLSFLSDEDLVIGVWNGQDHVAYPHAILDWHEIVNEEGYTISYCPLTGSAIHVATQSDFGVSGYLYNSNLIMYDRDSDSYWPQMLLRSASGSKQGTHLHLNNSVETTWANWKQLFPDTRIVNSSTGHSRNYSRYPYGAYKSCNSLACRDYIYFPVANTDSRFKAKDRVLVVMSQDSVKALHIPSYTTGRILEIKLDGVAHSVVISGKDNIAVAFETVRELEIEEWNIPAGRLVIRDKNSDNRWDITGTNMSDNAPSARLKAAKSYIAYWFSVAAFFPDVEIIEP